MKNLTLLLIFSAIQILCSSKYSISQFANTLNPPGPLYDIAGDSCAGTGQEIHDDGSFENGGGWLSTVTDGRLVLKFTPTSYPWKYNKFCIALTRTAAGSDSLIFDVVIYDSTGSGVTPGNLVYTLPGQVVHGIGIYTAFTWYSFDISASPTLANGSYFIGIKYDASGASQANKFVSIDQSTTTTLWQGYAYANTAPWTSATVYWPSYRSWGMRTTGAAPVSFGWAEQTSGVTGALYSISAADNNNVWACGAAGKVLKTNNGGTTWTSASGNIPASEIQYNIWAVDGNTALVTGSGTATHVYLTSNGGTNWTTVFTQTSGFIDNIWMTSATNGFMNGDPVGSRWSLWKTTNGGVNWDSTGMFLAQNGTETGFNNSFFVSGSNIWMGTSTNRVYYSTNNGSSWTAQSVDAQTSGIVSIWSNNPGSGKFFCGSDSLMLTLNSGTTWNFAGVQPGGGTITGALIGLGAEWWFARQAAVIYYSANDGTSWTSQYTAPNGVFYAMNKSRTGSLLWATRSTGGISKYGPPTGIINISSTIPNNYSLDQNFPNPFNPVTKIRFEVPVSGLVTLRVYNVLGKEVSTLVNETKNPGIYLVDFNGTELASGVYFYKLESNGFVSVKKMMLIK